jgi:phosphoglycolate phosphatase-like HAD superfamily hydrolase
VPPDVVLWDFGDTLVDERWMHRAPKSCPAWPNAWHATMDELGGDWDVGRASESDVVAALAARTGMEIEAVYRHIDHCCRSVTFHRFTWQSARQRRAVQALVTVNPDLFVQRIVPAYGLRAVFDAVVVSSIEGTTDKVRLCEIALQRVDHEGDRQSALLIDNRVDLVEAWERVGGRGYVYVSDEIFEEDAAALFGA